MQKLKLLLEKKKFRYLSYFLLTAVMISILWLVGQFLTINKLFEDLELKTLDFRYRMAGTVIKPNPDILIISIDDNSLEILENQYGRYPWSRDIYAKVINYLESGKADSIIFDLMFIGNQKGFEDKDKELAVTMGKYNNVYTSMNFDNRKIFNSPDLPETLKVNVENHSYTIDFNDFNFSSCRLILQDILQSTPNIGMINLSRDEDGITRRGSLLVKYKNDFYPYLGFKVAYDYLKKHENLNLDKFEINKNNQLLLGKRKIQLDKDGRMIINWYGDESTLPQVPFWQVIKSINAVNQGKKPDLSPDYFKDKIIFIGATAIALYDIKSIPLSGIFPGTEILATVFNNIVDNNPIKRVYPWINLLICTFLSIITGTIVLKLRSTAISSFIIVSVLTVYILFSSLLLKKFFIWVDFVNPILIITLTFTIMYIIKYLMKSKDFEYTYKLATTDGLTGLYNHRFFQEHLANSIERTRRYNSHISLLLIDIDFFKKFNDTYGHQAGDAVLRQVADTLKKAVRSSDLVARYGGEEMTVVLDNTDIEEAVIIANKICTTVAEKSFKLSETVERNVTISIGVATFPQHGEIPSKLIEFADKGLYRAKENGRNQVGAIE
ncbi:MAG: diguanylate cyclase [Candidatus Gastranaerophilales bacterium]|nr:diguanylate cyclase [Candidatus Gastranaerophilales bacterium]